MCHLPHHGPHADRIDDDYYNSSEDIMKMDEGADSRLPVLYEIVMTQIHDDLAREECCASGGGDVADDLGSLEYYRGFLSAYMPYP